MNRKISLFFVILLSISNLFTSACWSGNAGEEKGKTNSGPSTEIKSGGFAANVPDGFQMPDDDVGKKILEEYGSLFVARGGAVVPDRVVFKNTADVSAFQSNVSKSSETIGGIKIELQATAMKALKDAVGEAQKNNLSITPRGTDAARRNYSDTVKLWESRVAPGLRYWAGRGKISGSEAKRINSLSSSAQVPEIFKLEDQGIYFSKDLTKSIMFSVAPPGSSQHLSMLALDITEHENAKVRDILANHGWFQTVSSDLPHFTYIGVSEADLPKLGLKSVTNGGRSFWLPEI